MIGLMTGYPLWGTFSRPVPGGRQGFDCERR